MALTGATDRAGATEGAHDAVLPRPPRRRALLGSRRRQLAAGVIIAGAIGFILYEGLDNATVYFRTADQAVADRAQLGTRPFRIEGTVEPNVKQSGSNTDFSIYANGVTVAVVDTGSPPQLFKPGIPVVLEGHWQGNVYAADQIMVKHSASYTEAHPDRLKSQLPASTAGGGAGVPAASEEPGVGAPGGAPKPPVTQGSP